MDQEPNLEERLSEPSKKNLPLHLKYFAADGSSYACYYAFFMAFTERLVGLDWEQLKTTRGVGFVTGFLSGHIVNLLRERSVKDKATIAGAGLTPKKAAVDTAIGMVTTMPGYAPILYIAAEKTEQAIIFPLVIGSLVSGVAGLGYGLVSDWYRKRLGLEPVL